MNLQTSIFQAQQFDAVTRAQYRARAIAIIATDGWSAAMDLTMMQALGRGEGVAGAAKALGLKPGEVTQRFHAIRRAMTHRDYLPITAQEVLLEELRAAVTVVPFVSRRSH
jgi:hypothetical protein